MEHPHPHGDPFEALKALLIPQLEGLRNENKLILERLSNQEKQVEQLRADQQERDKKYSEDIKLLREQLEALKALLLNPNPSPISKLPAPGKFYFVRSKYGRWLDMRQDPETVEANEVQAITESYKNQNTWAFDSYMVELIDNHDGFYMFKSKHKRYLDLRQEAETTNALPALSLTEAKVGYSQWAKDSFEFRLIESDVPGYFFIKSKHGRYLDMRQEPLTNNTISVLSLSEPYMKANQWAKDSFIVEFIPA